MNQLAQYGWTDDWQRVWDESGFEGLQPARVLADFGTSVKIAAPIVQPAELSGRLAHYVDKQDVPKVGDWVAVRLSDSGRPVVEAVLPRRSEVSRKAAGNRTEKQIMAANVDVAFVVLALDSDFSIERLRRFLYQLSAHNIESIIVLNKADKTDNVQQYIDQLQNLDLVIITAIATDSVGVADILARINAGQTAVLLGSSGVGKSTLTNHLIGRDAQATRTVRQSDDTGRHTTVHRELFVLPNGGLLIDTPGIRELQLWGDEEKLNENYDDILLLMQQCKFSNCTHTTEPGCAIQAALAGGQLERRYYDNYLKMKSELAALVKRQARHHSRQSSAGRHRGGRGRDG